jgi:hypothetical protein
VIADLLERAYRDMDKSTGMFPSDWTCKGCGKVLNADGGHPAELYAGTFNGLCYACTGRSGFVVETFEDGCQLWSYPPHCPSWRRDRETAYGYADCPDCKGSGRVAPSRGQFGPIPKHCSDCLARHYKKGDKYDTRDVFSREDLTYDERVLRAYHAATGHEPPPAPEEPKFLAQWQYRGTPKERKALKEELLHG